MKTVLLTARNSIVYLLVLGSLALGGCADAKKVTYFNNIEEGIITSQTTNLEPVIQKSDILSITVTSPKKQTKDVSPSCRPQKTTLSTLMLRCIFLSSRP